MTSASTPISITDPGGSLRLGRHFGALAPVDLSRLAAVHHPSVLWRGTHHKRWMFVAITQPRTIAVVAIVHLGYAATAFVHVVDRIAHSALLDRSYLSVPFACRVSEGCEEGCAAWFRAPNTTFSLVRRFGASAYDLQAKTREIELSATLETVGSPSPIAVVSQVPGGSIHITQKRALLSVRGNLVVGAQEVDLNDAVAGFDYTQGLLARHTAWRWAFCQGRTAEGAAIAFNLVEGFNDGQECVVWLDGEAVAVAEPRFAYDLERPHAPWRISTDDGTLDLRFAPDSVHREQRNLGLIRSLFVQPAGTFSGSVRISGRKPATLDSSPGVVEHQDVLW